MKARVVAIVQARMGSTRLPGKVLMPAMGKPLLGHLIQRLGRCRTLDEVVIATSTVTADDSIAELCLAEGVACYRGSEHDVLARYMSAAEVFRAETVVRICGDSPLIDPLLVDEIVGEFEASTPPCDFMSNTINQTYPLGMNTEVFTSQVLREADLRARHAYEREHVTPYMYKNHDRFRICEKHHDPDLRGLRLTVDVEEDLWLVVAIFERLGRHKPNFGLDDIVDFCEANPELQAINSHIRQNEVEIQPLDCAPPPEPGPFLG